MTVAFDASSVATAGNGSPLTWTHTPVGTPRGVAVPIALLVDAGVVSAVTYGGVALALEIDKVAGGGESGRAQVWFLGSGIPTGAQTVSVTHNGSGVRVIPGAVTVIADTDTEVGDFDFVVGSLDDPSVSLTTTPVSLRVSTLYTGLGSTAAMDPVAGMTTLIENSNGFRTVALTRETTASAGTFAMGYTTTSTADMALVALAMQEVASPVPPAPPSSGGNRMGGTGAIRRPPRTYLHR